MKYILLKLAYSATFKQRVFQALLLGILFVGFIISNFAQLLTFERKVVMIDSANNARIEKYLMKCLPEYASRIKFEQDSSTLCSIDIALWVADDISDNQWPVLEKFMKDASVYFNTHKRHILIEYGIVPGSVDVTFDRMFKNEVMIVYLPDKEVTTSKVEQLVAVFNKVTDSYTGRRTKTKVASMDYSIK